MQGKKGKWKKSNRKCDFLSRLIEKKMKGNKNIYFALIGCVENERW